ncbi:MAG: hypothetical protein RR923_02920 [Bacilli bacterium]
MNLIYFGEKNVFGGDLVIGDNDLKGKIEYIQQINPDEDLILGVSAIAELKFKIYDANNLITDDNISNKNFIFKKSKSEEFTENFIRYAELGKPRLLCLNDEYAYCIYNDNDFKVFYNNLEFKNIVQPTEKIECIYCVDDTVYLGTKDRFLSYFLNGDKLQEYDLNAFQKTKIIKDKCITVKRQTIKNDGLIPEDEVIFLDDLVQEFFIKHIDLKPTEFIIKNNVLKQVGIFKTHTIDRKNDSYILINAYDNMNLFNKKSDNFLTDIIFPINLYNLLSSTCTFCNVKLNTKEILNGDFILKNKKTIENTTCRDILKWIGEISAGFCYIDKNGKLNMHWYRESEKQYTKDNFKEITNSKFIISRIDKLRIRVENNNSRIEIGNGNNIYTILNNPFIYTNEKSYVLPFAQKIFDRISNFDYTPLDFNTVLDNEFEGEIGEFITVDGIKTIVMSKSITGLIENYASFGNIEREVEADADFFQEEIIEKTEVVGEVFEKIEDEWHIKDNVIIDSKYERTDWDNLVIKPNEFTITIDGKEYSYDTPKDSQGRIISVNDKNKKRVVLYG